MSILEMSISGGVLILVIVIIRALAINRLPKATFLALWGIALCRLMLPVSVPSRFSIYNMVRDIGAAYGQKTATANFPHGTAEILAITTTVSHANFETMFWISGAVLLAVIFTVALCRCHQETEKALPVKGNALIDKWLSEQKTLRPIRVMVSDQTATPLAYGVVNPKIILPKFMDFDDLPQMKYILTHELIHIRHLDSLWKFVLIVVLCFHWFNPMVWVLYVLVNRDMELACDEKVIRTLGEDSKSAYALSLIDMAEQKAKFTPLHSGFSKNAVEERIVSVMKFRKMSKPTLTLALTLVLGVSVLFATSASAATVISLDDKDITVEASTNCEALTVKKSVSTDSAKLAASGMTEFLTVEGKSSIGQIPSVSVDASDITVFH